jgi:hypothetical protein
VPTPTLRAHSSSISTVVSNDSACRCAPCVPLGVTWCKMHGRGCGYSVGSGLEEYNTSAALRD